MLEMATIFGSNVMQYWYVVGYSHNSQWPPFNLDITKMDICTYYFDKVDDGLRRLPLVFTEVKRARNATVVKKHEQPIDCERQLHGYCSEWLKAARPKGAPDQVFANAIIGPYIRCLVFKGVKRMKPDGKTTYWEITMTDHNGNPGMR